MANTYTLIASNTVGSGGASSISFTSIPSTYTDLVIKLSARSSSTAGRTNSGGIRFNTATTSQDDLTLRGSGTAASSFADTYTASGYMYIGEFGNVNSTASTFTNTEIYIPNYAGSNNKSFSCDSVQEDNQTGAFVSLIAGLWSSSAAITQVDLYAITFNFVQYSTAYLYGVSKS
jgi:hypothetical protein